MEREGTHRRVAECAKLWECPGLFGAALTGLRRIFLGVGFPPLTWWAFFSSAPMALRHDAENGGARLAKVRKVSCALKFPKCRVGNEYFLQKYLLAAVSQSADDYRR